MLRLAALAVAAAFALSGAALARQTVRPAAATPLRTLRLLTDHYRALTWTYELAARDRRTPTSFSYRHATSRPYLRYTIDLWTRRADRAHRLAISRLERRLGVDLPAPAPLRASLYRRIASERRLALRLRGIYPGHISRSYRLLNSAGGSELLRAWQSRGALAALAVARHGHAPLPATLVRAFSCIHAYEGSWTANTGNGYYGGLQMDVSFEHRYGPEFVRRWGTADNWPVWAQLQAAVRAYQSGRGFWPWPNTARLCGLI
jgi:hypothetical protein